LDALSLDKNISDIFTRRLETAALIMDNPDNLEPDMRPGNEQALSDIAIKLEVLFDLPTPEYALKQRMAYQLEQLQLGIKPALSNEEKKMKLVKLELDWYRVGAVSVEARNSLEQRLTAVINQAEN
jgi:hypothetical protein